MRYFASTLAVLALTATISFAQSNRDTRSTPPASENTPSAAQSSGTNQVGGASQTSSQPSGMQASQSSSGNQGTVALPPGREKLGSGQDPTARINREVMHALLMNPYYTLFDDIAYSVNGNTVTLMGQVVDPGAKSDAAASVKHVEGVDHVNDNIEVLPPSNSDDQIRRAEYRAIFGFDGLSRYSWGATPPLHIIVKNGHVKLVGYVDNDGDKQLAATRANTVPGVFSVENDLQVVNMKTAMK
jgi:hyperosmotically inducible protein